MSAFDNMNAVLFYDLEKEIGMTREQSKEFFQGLRLMESRGFGFTVPDDYLVKTQNKSGDIATLRDQEACEIEELPWCVTHGRSTTWSHYGDTGKCS